jgi:hypothetical protein
VHEPIQDSVSKLVAAGETQADAVIIALQDSKLPGVCRHLLSEYPHVKILGVNADTRTAFLYEVRTQVVPVSEISTEGLISAIRVAVRVHARDER